MRFKTLSLALVVGLTCVMAQGEMKPEQAVKQSVIEFALDLLEKVAPEKSGKNLICSPLSIHTAVSMAAYGAGGSTADQMIQSLRLPRSSDISLPGIRGMIADLQNVQNVTLKIANTIYVASGWAFKTEYKQLTSDVFKSEVSPMDTGKPDGAAQSINGWVKNNTNNKIEKIISSADINGDTRMILLNAVYFKGNWKEKFDKQETRNLPFHVDQNKQKSVPTMRILSSFVHGFSKELNAQYVVLPYENSEMKMIIYVPKEIDGLSQIETRLRYFDINGLIEGGEPRKVELYLPKFKIESEINLDVILQELGMTDMFRANAANFSGITDEELYVDKVLHKAFIEVNEEGSEAAAVTSIQLQTRFGISAPEVRADRPFYFSIVHGNIPIFNGHVVELESEKIDEEPNKEEIDNKTPQQTSAGQNNEFKGAQMFPPTHPLWINQQTLNPQWTSGAPTTEIYVPQWSSPPIVVSDIPFRRGYDDRRVTIPEKNSFQHQSSRSPKYHREIQEFYNWFKERESIYFLEK